jgi:hypothetical protein
MLLQIDDSFSMVFRRVIEREAGHRASQSVLLGPALRARCEKIVRRTTLVVFVGQIVLVLLLKTRGVFDIRALWALPALASAMLGVYAAFPQPSSMLTVTAGVTLVAYGLWLSTVPAPGAQSLAGRLLSSLRHECGQFCP